MELQTVDTKRRMTGETVNTVAAGQLSVDPVWRDCCDYDEGMAAATAGFWNPCRVAVRAACLHKAKGAR